MLRINILMQGWEHEAALSELVEAVVGLQCSVLDELPSNIFRDAALPCLSGYYIEHFNWQQHRAVAAA